MANKKNGCSFPGCPHAPSTPENIRRGRCSLHPKPAAVTPRAQHLAGPTLAGPVAPVVAAQPPARPPIEIPDTWEGWEDVRREIEARLAPHLSAPPREMACAGGKLTVTFDLASSLRAQGHVALGRRRYYVRGNLWNVDVYTASRGTAGNPASYYVKTRVREMVQAAWDARVSVEGHVDLVTLISALDAAKWCVMRLHSYSRSDNTRDLQRGRDALLRLAALELRGKAHDVALQLIANGFHGTVQDLLDAAAAVVAERPGR